MKQLFLSIALLMIWANAGLAATAVSSPTPYPTPTYTPCPTPTSSPVPTPTSSPTPTYTPTPTPTPSPTCTSSSCATCGPVPSFPEPAVVPYDYEEELEDYEAEGYR